MQACLQCHAHRKYNYIPVVVNTNAYKHTNTAEEVGRGYDDIQMSHDKYRLHDDIIAYFTFTRDKIPNIFDILVHVT